MLVHRSRESSPSLGSEHLRRRHIRSDTLPTGQAAAAEGCADGAEEPRVMDAWNPTIMAYMDKQGAALLIHLSLIDLVRFERFTWRIDRDGYVYRNTRAGQKNVTRYLHRDVVDCPRGMQVDHKDNDPHNNTRENLAIVTPAENKALACLRRRWAVRYERRQR